MLNKTSSSSRPQTQRPNPHPPTSNESSRPVMKTPSSGQSSHGARVDGVQLSEEARNRKMPVSAPPNPQPSPLLTEPEFLGRAAAKGGDELERLIELRQDFRLSQAENPSVNALLTGLESWGLQEEQPQ